MAANPLNEPARISWSTRNHTRPAEFDLNGDAVINSAGDAFDPPAEKDESRWVATVIKNVANVPSWFLDYQDAINDADWTLDGRTIPAECAKLSQIQISEEQERNSVTYRVLTMQFDIRAQQTVRTGAGSGDYEGDYETVGGWVLAVLDAGFNELDAYGTQRRVITLDDGKEPTAPVLLDGTGYRLDDPGPDTATFLTFDVYPTKDFSVLPTT